jgi:hypothetical protein
MSKLSDVLQMLGRAGQPLDAALFRETANNIAVKATQLARGESSFHVLQTATGLKIQATNPTPAAKQALDRAVGDAIGTLKQAALQEGRNRLK